MSYAFGKPPTAEGLLKQWGLQELTHLFQDEDVDYEALLALTPDLINILVPKIGQRAKLRKHLAEYKQALGLPIAFEDAATYMPQPGASSSSDNPGRPDSSCSQECSHGRNHSIPNFPVEHLRELLDSTPKGQMVLNTYENHNSLDGKSRTYLVELIVARAIELGIQLDKDDYYALSREIVRLFPTENEAIYYIPACRIGDAHKIARGKLVDKWRNMRRSLRISGALSPASRKRKHATDTEGEVGAPDNDIILCIN